MEHQMRKRVVMAAAGVCLTGISVALFNAAVLGGDPFTVLCVGLGKVTGLTYGVLYTAICAGLFLAVLYRGRHYIGLATFFSIFGLGALVDVLREPLAGCALTASVEGRAALLVLGVLLLCLAASLYYTSNLGVSTYDAVALMLAERKFAPFRFCRMGTDVVCVLLGFSLDAPIGVGTLVTACCMGPLIQYFNHRFSEPLLRAAWTMPRRKALRRLH